jgi:hypothetical protein
MKAQIAPIKVLLNYGVVNLLFIFLFEITINLFPCFHFEIIHERPLSILQDTQGPHKVPSSI